MVFKVKPSAIIKGLLIMAILICFIACKSKGTEELPVLASYDFEDGQAEGWQPNDPEHWQVVSEKDSMVYELTAPGKRGKISAPTSWAVLIDHDVTSFVFTGRLKCNEDTTNPHRDICIFFHYQDPAHFYYVHFSSSSDERHNIIGLVNGTDRVKINIEPPGESIFRLTDTEWHKFKATCDANTGEIQVFLDDMETPILTAQDTGLDHGLVGVGSYDDTGYFDDIMLRGKKITEQ